MGGWVPAFQAVRVVFEGLIWPFSPAFGRRPPLVCECMIVERLKLALVAAAATVPRRAAKISWNISRGMATSRLAENLTAVAHNLRTDLDQFLFQAKQADKPMIEN